MYSTTYNLWTFTWFVYIELPFRLKKFPFRLKKFIPRDSLNSPLIYILFSLDISNIWKLQMYLSDTTLKKGSVFFTANVK